MFEVFVAAILVSHLFAVAPFVRALAQRRLPGVLDFACVSIVAYDDTGLLLDAFTGLGSASSVMRTVRESPPAVQTFTLCLVLAAPWLLRLGAHLHRQRPAADGPRLLPARYPPFVFLALATSFAIAAYGVQLLASGLPIWVIRSQLGARLGAAVLVFYLPMYLLAYYLTLEESKTRLGLLVSALLAAAAIAGTAPVGERTLLLAPILMLGLFRGRPSLARLVPLAAAGVLAAALLLPRFKWQFDPKKSTAGGLVLSVLHGDFNRSYTLGECASRAALVGTEVMRYPLAGYVYTAALFVPRSWAPFKGESSAISVTAAAHHADPATLSWGYGIGFLEEAMLNVGLLFTPLVTVLVGWAWKWLDGAGSRLPGIAVAARLCALWSCGYDSAALLLTYGGAVLLAVVLNLAFARRAPAPEVA